jgi:transposase
MSQKPQGAITVVGIEIGKNSFHVVDLDKATPIMLRQKWSRGGQVEARFANLPPRLVGMEARVGAHHLSRRHTALGHEPCRKLPFLFSSGGPHYEHRASIRLEA